MTNQEKTQTLAEMIHAETTEGQLIRLKKRMAEAVRMLEDMIDGGEECRGRDSELSEVIRKLEGK